MGWADKQKTLLHAMNVEAEARAIRNGEKTAPPSWQKNRNKSIRDVIVAYLAWGRTQGGRYGRPWDSQNSALKERTLKYWTEELGLTVLADIELVRVERATQDLFKAGLAPKTVALRVEGLRSLCCWAVRRGLLPENPLRGLARFDTRARTPHRSLSDSEVAALLKVADPQRRLWYETALRTGFRLNELRFIRVKDVDPFGPSIFLAADFSKDRKDHRQLIKRELFEKLKALTKNRHPEERLLGIPKGPDPAEYIKEDYAKANIPIMTDEGKATWHSLRKVFINNVVKSGADLKTIMELARHSTATMSMDVYAKPKPDLLRAAIASVEKDIVAAEASCTTGVPQISGENSTAAANELGRSASANESKWAILDSNQ